MRDGVQKNCGSSDWRAFARRDMSEIQVHIYVTLLEVLNWRESDVGGKLLAGLHDLGAQ
jgi:hypothetical protein